MYKIFGTPSSSQIINFKGEGKKYIFFIFDIINRQSFENIKGCMNILGEDIYSNNLYKILLGYNSTLNENILQEFHESILSKRREDLQESFILDDYFYELNQASIKINNLNQNSIEIINEESKKLANSYGMIYFEIFPFMDYDTFFESILTLIERDENK